MKSSIVVVIVLTAIVAVLGTTVLIIAFRPPASLSEWYTWHFKPNYTPEELATGLYLEGYRVPPDAPTIANVVKGLSVLPAELFRGYDAGYSENPYTSQIDAARKILKKIPLSSEPGLQWQDIRGFLPPYNLQPFFTVNRNL